MLTQVELEKLIKIACRYTKNMQDAEDVVSGTVEKVLKDPTKVETTVFRAVNFRLRMDCLSYRYSKRKYQEKGKVKFLQLVNMEDLAEPEFIQDFIGPIAIKELVNMLTPEQEATVLQMLKSGFKVDKDISSHVWWIRQKYKEQFK